MKEQLIHIKDLIDGEVHKYYNTRTRLIGDVNDRSVKIAALRVVIDALGLGAIEDEIKALGYASIQAAHDDAPKHITDPVELKEVQMNLTEFIAVLASLAPMTDKSLVMTQITSAKGVIDSLEEIDGKGIRRIDKFNKTLVVLAT